MYPSKNRSIARGEPEAMDTKVLAKHTSRITRKFWSPLFTKKIRLFSLLICLCNSSLPLKTQPPTVPPRRIVPRPMGRIVFRPVRQPVPPKQKVTTPVFKTTRSLRIGPVAQFKGIRVRPSKSIGVQAKPEMRDVGTQTPRIRPPRRTAWQLRPPPKRVRFQLKPPPTTVTRGTQTPKRTYVPGVGVATDTVIPTVEEKITIIQEVRKNPRSWWKYAALLGIPLAAGIAGLIAFLALDLDDDEEVVIIQKTSDDVEITMPNIEFAPNIHVVTKSDFVAATAAAEVGEVAGAEARRRPVRPDELARFWAQERAEQKAGVSGWRALTSSPAGDYF